MARQNRYYRRSRIKEWKFRQIVRLFALDFPATDVAALTGLTTKSVNTIFLKIRERRSIKDDQMLTLPNNMKNMNLLAPTPQKVDDFKVMCRKEFGVELTDNEAWGRPQKPSIVLFGYLRAHGSKD